MNPTTIPIEQLQQDVRATVEETLHLVRAAAKALADSTAGREKKRFAKFESRLEQELKNVDSLELRIAVVPSRSSSVAVATTRTQSWVPRRW